MKIVVNTPAGNIGRPLVEGLLNAHHEVMVITRHPDKVVGAVQHGARLIQGSVDDRGVLQRAFNGADAVFWLTPIAFDQPQYVTWAKNLGKLASEVAKEQGVRRAVVISTYGAERGSRSGFLDCSWEIEQSFAQALDDVTVLRPGSFMENFLNNVPTIATAGAIFGRYPTSKRNPMIATRDIAAKALEALVRPVSKGFRILELHGPADLDQPTAAAIISEAIGREVKYVEVTEEQARAGMLQAGMPGFLTELMLEMYSEQQAGRMVGAQPRSAETTTPTTLQQFAREVLKPAIDAARRAA